MDIDATIAAHVAAEAQTEVKNEPTEVIEEAPKAETEVEAPDAETETKEDLFPKKAVNAISRRDKQIGKLKAELQARTAEVEALKQKAPIAADTEPKEEDFETYGQYLKAVAKHEAKQSLNEIKAAQQEDNKKTQQDEWASERKEVLKENQQLAAKTFPDFQKVMVETLSDVEVAPHVRQAFLEADNAAFALYALAKEGMGIDDLNEMSPIKVAMTLARMEDKGLSLSKTKKISNAPAPINPSKGLGSGGKDISAMSTEELLRWAKS